MDESGLGSLPVCVVSLLICLYFFALLSFLHLYPFIIHGDCLCRQPLFCFIFLIFLFAIILQPIHCNDVLLVITIAPQSILPCQSPSGSFAIFCLLSYFVLYLISLPRRQMSSDWLLSLFSKQVCIVVHYKMIAALLFFD